MKGRNRLFLVFSLMTLMVILLVRCMDFRKAEPATEKTIAGAATCRQCHAEISDSYLQNVHQHTSRAVDGDNVIDGPLPHSSEYVFNEHLKLKVEKRNDGMYQVVYQDGKETLARRFDIAFGGEKAYTYGTWQGEQLKQLPLSYLKQINSWTNSPGFPKDNVHFDRTINSRCMECHSSFAAYKVVQDGPVSVKEELVKGSIVYGIDCERCHGPAGKHVEFHLDHPQEKAAKYIALYKTLNRQQKVDACAVCHSGNDMQFKKSTFAFKPGDDLRDYYTGVSGSVAKKEPDVHGNQSTLLAESQCFIQSKTMECSSCHSTHENLKGNLTAYSKKCISCHATIKHSTATLKNAVVKTNCIDCHMPKQTSGVISFQQAGKADVASYMLRTHKIGIYQ